MGGEVFQSKSKIWIDNNLKSNITFLALSSPDFIYILKAGTEMNSSSPFLAFPSPFFIF